jgi:hypothetical protein
MKEIELSITKDNDLEIRINDEFVVLNDKQIQNLLDELIKNKCIAKRAKGDVKFY